MDHWFSFNLPGTLRSAQQTANHRSRVHVGKQKESRQKAAGCTKRIRNGTARPAFVDLLGRTGGLPKSLYVSVS